MPLVENLPLPIFERLRRDGHTVLTLDQATHQDIRALHIGLLNMMPDTALSPTERQFLRLIGSCNQIAQFYVHPFTVPGLERSREAEGYLGRFYKTFAQIQAEGLDALIITGANVSNPALSEERFWKPLLEVVAWATQHVTSIYCSCLSTHALLLAQYGLQRRPLKRKKWGVFPHRAARVSHPLLRDINTRFDVPHSRWNEITREQLTSVGITPLIESTDGDVHLAVSPDGLRVVYSQGHPEYDACSLLKEFKRDRARGAVPENYFPPAADGLLWRDPFPEAELEQLVDNTWGDTGKAVFNNWIGLVYQLTHVDRKKPFMDGIDPSNPLGWSELLSA